MTPNNPMTEGEALAVGAFQNAMEAEHGYRPQVFATGVLMNSRDADRYEGWKLALTAHTAASGGEVAGWQRRYRTEGMEWSRWHGWEPDGREDPFPKTSGRWSNEFRPVYTAPPAAVPADALERLVAKWRSDRSDYGHYYTKAALALCASELAALIRKEPTMGSVDKVRARELLTTLGVAIRDTNVAVPGHRHAFVEAIEIAAAALREQPEARGVVDAESLLDELESAAEDYSGRGLLWQGFRSRDERLAVVQAALTAAQQPVQEGGGGVVMPNLKASDPSYSHAERQWVFGYNAALADVMCLNRSAAPPSAPVGVDAAVEHLKDRAFPNHQCPAESSAVWNVALYEMANFLTQQPAQAAPGWKLVGQTRVPTGERPRTPGDDPLGPPVITEWETHYRWEATISRVTKTPTPPGDDAAGGGHG